MTKYQEKKFKDFVRTIESLIWHYNETFFIKPQKLKELKKIEIYYELKDVRIAFFKWFKKQIG